MTQRRSELPERYPAEPVCVQPTAPRTDAASGCQNSGWHSLLPLADEQPL